MVDPVHGWMRPQTPSSRVETGFEVEAAWKAEENSLPRVHVPLISTSIFAEY